MVEKEKVKGLRDPHRIRNAALLQPCHERSLVDFPWLRCAQAFLLLFPFLLLPPLALADIPYVTLPVT